MGGQACVFYGAAEFSRSFDLFVLADPSNLERLKQSLAELKAENIAVPPFEAGFLERGHAVHFRCAAGEVRGLRIDIMAELRGGPPFEELWARRTVLDAWGTPVDVMAVEDLVRAKKTQRDKDWPMIRRLVEQVYFESGREPDPRRVEFLLRELRTPDLLIDLAERYPEPAARIARERPGVRAAQAGDVPGTAAVLAEEEARERTSDREYWSPLRQELERLRRLRRETE